MRKIKKLAALFTAAILAAGSLAVSDVYTHTVYADNTTAADTNPTAGAPSNTHAAAQSQPAATTGISAPNVTVHSAADIRAFAHSHPVIYMAPVYDQKPSLTSPYNAGTISAKTRQDALNALNLIRYIAGLSSDITLNDTYSSQAQAACLVNAANNIMSAKPAQPAGMDSSLYNLAVQGAGSSNLGIGYGNLTLDLVLGWMNDSPRDGTSQISEVGHRRWCLNPPMKQTGFGYVEHHSAMYITDHWTDASTQDSMWPAQNTPYQFMPNYFIWSFSTGHDESAASVKVQLRNLDTGKSWNFSSSENSKDFAVSNHGYGQSGCIMFRPEGMDYSLCQHYQVTISGTSRGTIQYPVTFFDLPEVEIEGFNDVGSTAYYRNAIYWARAAGIASGTSRSTYSPAASCTRAQMATFLWRMAGSPSTAYHSEFTDVSASSPYASAIAWVKKNNITSGTSATTFSPNAPCSRAQMATFLWRMAGSPSVSSTAGFSDVASDAWYAQAVAWAKANNITSGTTARAFSPDATCSRGQMATFLYRYHDINSAKTSATTSQTSASIK